MSDPYWNRTPERLLNDVVCRATQTIADRHMPEGADGETRQRVYWRAQKAALAKLDAFLLSVATEAAEEALRGVTPTENNPNPLGI